MAENRFGGIPVQPENSGGRFGGIPVQQTEQEPVAEFEGFFQEIGEGIGSGVIGIFEGIGEVGALGIDYVTGTTNYAQNVNEAADYAREITGFDPSGALGKGAEVITQFFTPGLGAAMILTKGAKAAQLAKGLYEGQRLSKAQKAGIGAKSLGIMAAADIVVANDGMTTISDFFSFLR